MYKEAIRPVWAEINLSNLDYNIKNIMKKVGPQREIIGVIKADAYGHGDRVIARTLAEEGVKWFAVSCLAEALHLRRGGVQQPILVLGMTQPNQAAILAGEASARQSCSSEPWRWGEPAGPAPQHGRTDRAGGW